ncbi:dynein regulatory complex protein 1 isoform X3 [Scophthalmus maximus]|uniref:dynein regulatory complex protein 1 isoform X3 n=1 Tax=Scophthalmus maximus TaxID=52904 RepID=UPI0015E0A071|nr:dynein regulatory complex protein 1 isoform X3 [Scophthalmus maximus]
MSEADNAVQTTRVSTQEADVGPGAELSEGAMGGEQEEQVPHRISSLQRYLTTPVTNIQTAADARESMRRKELEQARKVRLEWLENDVRSSQEKFEEITKGWSMAKDKVTPRELQEALSGQQQLCALLVENKKKLINDLQQELKVGDDRYVKDLRKQVEELDLMMERMEDQVKTLTKAYREELAQLERVYQQENKVLLITDKKERHQLLKKLWDEELERLAQRKKKVEEYEAKIHSLMLETIDKQSVIKTEETSNFQVLEREQQQMQGTNMIMRLKQIKERDDVETHKFNLANMKSRIISLQAEKKNLVTNYMSQVKQFRTKSRHLSKDHKRNIQQYERIQKTKKHFAVADARRFDEMWLTLEEEVRQLVERALVIDQRICERHLGLAWERPALPSSPFQPKKPARTPDPQPVSQLIHTEQSSQCSQGTTTDASGGPGSQAEGVDADACGEQTAAQSESDAWESEEARLSTEMKVMELLCDETGFLMEDQLLKMLAPLEKQGPTSVKLGSLLSSLGVEEEDLPKLADFLLTYQQQQTKVSSAAERVSIRTSTFDQAAAVETNSDLIHPNHVLPALKSFLKQHMKSRESSGPQQSSVPPTEARDSSTDGAYWERMGNVIPEEKVKLWEAARNLLEQHLEVLQEISELVPETDRLEQQNAELRMLLQQSLNQ